MSVSPSVGETIAGRYELRALLRECASRQVFRAFDLEVEVEVALWWMRPALFASEDERKDFEARAMQRKALKHPHIIRLFEVGRSTAADQEPVIYLGLQLGTSAQLESDLRAGHPTDEGNFLRYAEGMVAAVQGAHEAGQVHGFLTPADVVEVAGQVKLCGVGLFGFLPPARAYSLWEAESRYLAPELAQGVAPAESADWYSVALILLELATGAQGQPIEDALEELRRHAPARAAALAPALLTDPVLRGNGTELLLAIRSAWHDPLAEEELPTVIDEQKRTTLSQEAPAPRDVGVISFLDDSEDRTTVLQQRAPIAGQGEPVLKLDMVSRKPGTPFEQKSAKEMPEHRSPIRPVLRPLSSLAPPAPGPQDLGNLAPPKPSERRSGYWLYLVIALILGALSVAGLMALRL